MINAIDVLSQKGVTALRLPCPTAIVTFFNFYTFRERLFSNLCFEKNHADKTLYNNRKLFEENQPTSICLFLQKEHWWPYCLFIPSPFSLVRRFVVLETKSFIEDDGCLFYPVICQNIYCSFIGHSLHRQVIMLTLMCSVISLQISLSYTY